MNGSPVKFDMFNLEPAIAEWRQQMLAAGIKTPVPLEELESHLRDEIEERKRAGSSSEQAFDAAVQQIGQAGILESEFDKADETNERHRMNDIMFGRFGRIVAIVMFAGMLIILSLMLYGVLQHPASVSQGGRLFFVTSVVALSAYGGLALWVRSRPTGVFQFALARGAGIGLLLGVAMIANMSVENFAAFGTPVRAALGISMWGFMFLSFGIVGSATYNHTGSQFQAVIASVWSAAVSTVITLLYGFSTSLLFMPHMERILEGAFAQSGMTDSQAFVVQNAMNAASAHLMVAPCMAVFFGFIGGIACMLLRPVRRSTAISLGVLEFALVGAGLASIHFAESLNRADRGPFIMGGLLALGMAMACAHSVYTAIRRETATE